MSVQLVRGDARALPLADNSVDLVVTSPPYFALRSYEDDGVHYEGQIGDEDTPQQYVESLLEVTRELVRVTKPSGSIWVNLGDKYAERTGPPRPGGVDDDPNVRRPARRPARGRRGGIPVKSLMLIPQRYAIRCVDELGLIARAEVVWSKTNGMPESVTDRVRRSHEHWFHFTLKQRYYADMDPIREPSPRPTRRKERRAHEAGSLPTSVWTIPTEPLDVPEHLGTDHYAAYPTEGPRRIIQGWCPPGGTVLDPFGGTGTTALVASVLGCHGISVEKSAGYNRIATWRTTDPRQVAKAARRPFIPSTVPIDGQASILDLLA